MIKTVNLIKTFCFFNIEINFVIFGDSSKKGVLSVSQSGTHY